MGNHIKTTTLWDTGTHRVDVIEDVDPACDWVAIYKFDDAGEVTSVMRLHGNDVRPYKELKEMVPDVITNPDAVTSVKRKYKAAIKQYTKYIQAGVNIKAEYFRGTMDGMLEILKAIDPEIAGQFEEEKLKTYYD